MKIYEITFFVGNIPKFGGQLLASLYFTAFLKNPLRVVDAKKKKRAADGSARIILV